MNFLDAEKTDPVAEVIGPHFAQRRRRRDAELERSAPLDGRGARLDPRRVVRNGHRLGVIVSGAVADGIVHFSPPRPVREMAECAK